MRSKIMTQNKEILAHLKEHKTIDSIQALNEYGCFRLGARIYDLKQDGFIIQTRMVTNKQNKKSFAQYEYIGHESEPRQEQLL
jgi:hypothetical protein